MALPSSTPEERLNRSIDALKRSNWTSWDAIAAFRANTRLFVQGDIEFCDFNNGGGERCIVCGWSSKRGALGLDRNATIYASYARSQTKEHKFREWELIDHRNRVPLVWLNFVLPAELPMQTVAVPDARVRALVLDRYAQRVPHAGRCR